MTANLAAALAAFQAEMPTVAKAHTAKVGQYSYTYADLADVTEAAMPLLSKHGLAFTACPRATERGYELVGRLLHNSGESIEGALPLSGGKPQEWGSSITYMRRYLFGCITGVVTDDDDDGQAAQSARSRPKSILAPPASDAPPTRTVQRKPVNGGGITEPQLKKMGALMRERGMTDRDRALEFVASVIGKRVESRNDLTVTQASAVIDELATGQSDDVPPPADDDPWAAS